MAGERKEAASGFRWWLFTKISRFGWWVCPEPHKTRLYQSMTFDTDVWKNTIPWPHGEHCTIPGCPYCGGRHD